MNRSPNIAIIGANSFIARNIIYVLKNDFNIAPSFLCDIGEIQLDGEKNYRQVNILDIESVKNIDFSADLIFVFAGKTGTLIGFDNYASFVDINEKGLLNILNEYREQNSKAKIIFPSTRLIYKGQNKKLKESDEKEFKTIYAMNKFACEQYLAQYQNLYGIKYCIFRISVPYGTLIPNTSSYGTAEFMLSKAKKGEAIQLYGDGKIRRTITYMRDLCNILIGGAMSTKCINDVYNIGGEEYCLKDMAELVAKIFHTKVEFLPWPPNALKIESGDTVFDDSKLKEILPVKYGMTFECWCNNWNF